MTFQACAIIPSRNHTRVLGAIVATLRQSGLPVIIVDDASDAAHAAVIAGLHAPADGVETIRFDVNQGKGGAVVAGFRRARERGFTHAVQVDADGQHDLGALPALMAEAQALPDACIAGRPIYDDSIPLARKIGRWATHVWVWVETLSFRIVDSMCGFRVYPLAATLAVVDAEPIGRFMDFDTDILVRLFWRGVPVVQLPVRVIYPEENTSNFRLWQDNWRITRMHTRLVFTMLLRLPSILANRPPVPRREAEHWSGLNERGLYLGMRIVAATAGLFGRRASLALLLPIVSYFYATDAKRRRHSLDYLARIRRLAGEPAPGWRDGLRHYMNFAAKALDAFIAWASPRHASRVAIDDPAYLEKLAADPRGAVLIVSHLGNAEISRAGLHPKIRDRITVLVHTLHARQYNRLVQQFNPQAAVNMMQVTDMGPDTAIALQERVDRGEWIAIAGDRTAVSSVGRSSSVPFLGDAAEFSQGPYILAALMGCPVYLMFCLREGDGYRMYLEPFAERIVLPRQGRDTALRDLAARYAERLAERCRQAPLQWYNFYDFWASSDTAADPNLGRAGAFPGAFQ